MKETAMEQRIRLLTRENPSSSGSQPSTRNLLLAIPLILGVVVLWIGMAEVMQRASVSGIYYKPYLTAYCAQSSFSLLLIPWFLVRKIRGRSSKSTVDWKYCLKVSVCLSLILLTSTITWYLSLETTSVSGNSAVYQASPAMVFILSVLFLNEKATWLKVASVITAIGGVIIIIFSTAASSSEDDEIDETVFGYAVLLIAMLTYSSYSVVFKKFGVDSPETKKSSTQTAVLYVGLLGVVSLLFLWPFLVMMHFSGLEALERPKEISDVYYIMIMVPMKSLYHACLITAVVLSTPTLVVVGCTFVIPATVVSDKILHAKVLPGFAYLGVVLIVLSFIGINFGSTRFHLEKDTKFPICISKPSGESGKKW